MTKNKTSNIKEIPIVLIHGAWHGSWCWELWSANLKKAGFKNVITVDLSGHKGSNVSAKHMRISNYVEDVEAVLKSLDQPPILIGHSLGCSIIERICASYSFPAAVLVAPIPSYKVIRKVMAKQVVLHPNIALKSLFRRDMKAWVSSPNSHQLFFSKYIPEQTAKEYTKKMSNESLDLFLLDLPKKTPEPINVTPFLVVAAENDKFFSVSEQSQNATNLQADFLVIPDSGHNVMLDVGQAEALDRIVSWTNRKVK